MNHDLSTNVAATEVVGTLDFDEIYEQYYTQVYRYVGYRVDNRSDVEDVTSQVFFKIYKKLSSYNPKTGPLSPWIFTIAGNTVRDYYRRGALRRFISLDSLEMDPEDEFSMEENTEQGEEYETLRKYVKELPKRERTLISLKYGAELSYEEIAEVMNITPNHVGVLLHRCLKELKKSMEGYYEKI